MMKFRSVFVSTCAALALAGCMGNGGTATQMVSATQGMRGLMQSTEPPTQADYALSCAAVNSRLSNLYARYAEVEAEQRGRQRQQAMVGGLLDVGTTLIGGRAIMGAGSATGIQNTAMAVNYGRSALGGLAQAETSTQQLKDVNDAMLIAQRAAQLEKVKFEKGC
ncbi:hypothetical protein QCN27_15755 [Cereibacter sp. SYSU M97828]|nr:hypothetical protein [Cereibacter flavus]